MTKEKREKQKARRKQKALWKKIDRKLGLLDPKPLDDLPAITGKQKRVQNRINTRPGKCISINPATFKS